MIALALLLAQAAVPPPAPGAPRAAEASNAGLSAKDVYVKRCTFCHAEDGTGQTKKGKQLRVPDFTSAKWQKHTEDKEITDIIENGNKKRKMPAFKDKLTPEQIAALVPYLRAFAAR
jgi:mono/diheme cytochrome c family protein